jgi:hypothetical protein
LQTSNDSHAVLGEATQASAIGFSGAMNVAFTFIADMDANDTAFIRLDFRSGSKTVDVHADTIFTGYLLG